MEIEKNKRLDLIFKRNQLMAKLLIIFYLTSITINLIIDPVILLFVAPVGFIFCFSIYTMAKKKAIAYLTMYLSIFFIFSFFSLLITYEPLLINFIYIWLGLIMSSIYHLVRPILFAGFITSVTTVYFFFQFHDEIFPRANSVDVIYIVLFGWIITAFLVFSSRFTENLLLQAEEKNEITAKELMKTKGYLDSLFNQLTDPIVIHDENGRVFQVNKGFEETYGWKNREVTGRLMPQLERSELNRLQKRWKSVLEGEAPREIEIKNQTKNKQILEVAMSVSAIRIADERVVALVTIIRDITEKKQTEEFMRRSEKLSVVGQLAAGVAHEIRNPITVISGFLQLMQQRNQPPNDHLPVMLSELARINKIISEFLLLAKPGVERFERVQLRPLMEEVITLLSTSAIMKSISISSTFTIDHTAIDCEPNQIKQVLINLIKNSIEAMDHGGQIHVAVYEKEESIHIQIKDDGIGIPKEVLDRIGEPFFTTKEKGTGLGLMICDRIIAYHHGKMEITSEGQKGTTVDIFLHKVISQLEADYEYSSEECHRKN